MKKMVLALIAALTMTTSMMAQDDNRQNRERRQFDRTEMLKQRTDRMVKAYGLNEEQAKQLLDLNTKYAEQMGPGRGFRPGGERGQRPERMERMNAPRPDSMKNAPRPQMEMNGNFEKMREAREAFEKDLQKILTEEQFKAYKEDEAKRQSMGPRGPRGPRDRGQGPRQQGDMK
ncbi:MAG: DUF4890 domain-containing protein [Prevotella sp.]|nr:DUF4890 domain-containing protein [Prevotella sp.]